MLIPKATTSRRKARIPAILGVAGAVLVGLAAPATAAAGPPALTLSAIQGPNNGGNTIIATTPAASPTFFPGVVVQFQSAAADTGCASNYTPPVQPTASVGGSVDTGALVLTANKIAINVPGFGPAPLSTKYDVCVYSAPNAQNGYLVAGTAVGTQYSIAAPVQLSRVWPVAGPAQGGTTVTVFGNNLPQGLTATLGGLPLLGISVNANGQSFTGVTSPHAASTAPVALIVTSPIGNTILGKAFTFSNGITVSPNTGPNNRMGGTPVDVQGVGFGGFNFVPNGAPDDKNAHIYLVKGLYDPTGLNGSKANGPVVECTNPSIVSDAELVCTMNLGTSLTASGANALPTRSITADVTTTAASGSNPATTTLTNITPPLLPNDVNERISGTGIPVGTSIASINGSTATLSTSTATTAKAVKIAVGSATVTATINGPSTNPNAPPVASLTATTAIFNQSDFGRVVTGPGIPAGATIVGISPDGMSAGLSAQPLSTTANATITISDGVPVPTGTYTLTIVSNGSVGAATSDSTYTNSIISSGSTFTVADY
jgi:hypothetical protein